MILLQSVQEDIDRRFIITFYLADDTAWLLHAPMNLQLFAQENTFVVLVFIQDIFRLSWFSFRHCQVGIFEPPQQNSGVIAGKFLERAEYKFVGNFQHTLHLTLMQVLLVSIQQIGWAIDHSNTITA